MCVCVCVCVYTTRTLSGENTQIQACLPTPSVRMQLIQMYTVLVFDSVRPWRRPIGVCGQITPIY